MAEAHGGARARAVVAHLEDQPLDLEGAVAALRAFLEVPAHRIAEAILPLAVHPDPKEPRPARARPIRVLRHRCQELAGEGACDPAIDGGGSVQRVSLSGQPAGVLRVTGAARAGGGFANHQDTFEQLERHVLSRGEFQLDDWRDVVGNDAARAATFFENLSTTVRPLLKASYAFNDALHGPWPTGYLAVNVALHVLSSALVYVLLRRILAAHAIASPWDIGRTLGSIRVTFQPARSGCCEVPAIGEVAAAGAT